MKKVIDCLMKKSIIACVLFAIAIVPAGMTAESKCNLKFGKNILPEVSKWKLGKGASLEDGTIKITNEGKGHCIAYYSSVIDQSKAKTIILKGESYSQDIKLSKPSTGYSLRIDILYKDGTKKFYNYNPFSGKDSWEQKKIIFEPEKPVKSVFVAVMLYNIKGTVWFRNLTLQEQLN